MTPDMYAKLVWNYTLSSEDFTHILLGEKIVGTFNQDWVISRVLENLNYYEVMSLIPHDILKKRWGFVSKKLFNESVKSGYEFLLHLYPLQDKVLGTIDSLKTPFILQEALHFLVVI